MSDTELRLEKKMLPYSDGSGYRFKVEILRHSEGSGIRIHQHSDYVEIIATDWLEVRDTIDRMLDFMSDEPQSSPPDASMTFSNESESDGVSLKSDTSLKDSEA